MVGTRRYRNQANSGAVRQLHLRGTMPELLPIQTDAVRDEFRALLADAGDALDAGQLWHAEALARRARCIDPDHAGAAAVQCSILRSLNRTEQAVAISEPFAASNFTPLLTTRAEALCDLGRHGRRPKAIGGARAGARRVG